jgi:hypothetical protein
LLCRGWGRAMAAAAGAAAAETWEGPGRSPVGHRSSTHTSSRRVPSVPRDAYADDDEDDTWADRLWHDMQDHKRRAAMAAAAAAAGRAGSSGLFSAGSSRAEAARERERKAAAAAAESARILKEEQAKDADWRAAMMRQVEEVRRCHKNASISTRHDAVGTLLSAQRIASAASRLGVFRLQPAGRGGLAAV